MRVTLPQVEIRAYPVSLKGEAASRVLLVGLGYFPSLLLIDSLKIGSVVFPKLAEVFWSLVWYQG